MATPKFKKQFDEMLKNNEALFDHYLQLEKDYEKNPDETKEELESVKNKLMRIIRRNEDMLCSKSENTKYGVYSENLAMKFWEEVRNVFPRIDAVLD